MGLATRTSCGTTADAARSRASVDPGLDLVCAPTHASVADAQRLRELALPHGPVQRAAREPRKPLDLRAGEQLDGRIRSGVFHGPNLSPAVGHHPTQPDTTRHLADKRVSRHLTGPSWSRRSAKPTPSSRRRCTAVRRGVATCSIDPCGVVSRSQAPPDGRPRRLKGRTEGLPGQPKPKRTGAWRG